MYNKNYSKKFILGFGLIEIMISATLLSIGLLGAASIQSQSLNITMDSSLQTTAGNMIDQLMNFIPTMDANELQTMISASSSTLGDACNNTNCASGNFYASLLAGWRNSVTLLLPYGQSCLCLNKSDPNNPSIRIAVQWTSLTGKIRQEPSALDIPIVPVPTSPLQNISDCMSTNASTNNAGCPTYI